MSTAKIIRRALTLLTLSVVLGVSAAEADTKLVSAEPSPNSAVSAPQMIQLRFDEAIAKKSSSVELTDAAGNAVASMPMAANDASSLALMPDQPLRAGVYTVSWTAMGTDGHEMTGRFSFTVK